MTTTGHDNLQIKPSWGVTGFIQELHGGNLPDNPSTGHSTTVYTL